LACVGKQKWMINYLGAAIEFMQPLI